MTVPKLIALESYGVHNLVTTVRGLLAENVGSVEAVRRCFPPGKFGECLVCRNELMKREHDGCAQAPVSAAVGRVRRSR